MHRRESNPWCVVPKPKPKAVIKLVCFPYAGASASIFALWPRRLPEAIEVCGIQLPGRQNRFLEPPFTRTPLLVRELGAALLPSLDRPFAFFGHSVGAILIFEVTRWLRRHRNPMPQALFVSGRRAPQIPGSDPPFHLMNSVDFLAAIRKLNATPEEILADPDLLQLILPALRADMELCETYEYVDDASLSCPIVGFAGLDDDDETLQRMYGWRLQTTGDFSLHALPGDHFFIHSSERQLLALLRMELSKK
jgi:medium-chain acyl-[acyl-carrier-protein] hydrolase